MRKSAISSSEESLRNEIKLLDRLDHPHIVRVYQVFEDADELCLVMELCEGGEACEANCSMSEPEVASLVSQVLGALIYMHGHGVCHRDIKPGNILFKDRQRRVVKVADFGISKLFAVQRHGFALRHQMKGLSGTPGYWAPEVYYGRGYTEKCDMWSLGVVTFVELTGTLPFHLPADGEAMVPDPDVHSRPIQLPSHTSPEARSFVEALLALDPSARPSSEEALEFSFLRNHAEAIKRQGISSLKLPAPVIVQGLQGMQKYARAGPLWRLAAAAAARHVDNDCLWEATKAFDSFDSDQDGRIPTARCRELLLSEEGARLSAGMSAEDADEVVKTLEEDGFVNYIGFLAAVLSSSLKNPRYIADAFQMLDTDGDALVNADDLEALLGREETLGHRLRGLADAHGQISMKTFAELIEEESPRAKPTVKASRANVGSSAGGLKSMLQRIMPCCSVPSAGEPA